MDLRYDWHSSNKRKTAAAQHHTNTPSLKGPVFCRSSCRVERSKQSNMSDVPATTTADPSVLQPVIDFVQSLELWQWAIIAAFVAVIIAIGESIGDGFCDHSAQENTRFPVTELVIEWHESCSVVVRCNALLFGIATRCNEPEQGASGCSQMNVCVYCS